jgi:hypothetical protein
VFILRFTRHPESFRLAPIDTNFGKKEEFVSLAIAKAAKGPIRRFSAPIPTLFRPA